MAIGSGRYDGLNVTLWDKGWEKNHDINDIYVEWKKQTEDTQITKGKERRKREGRINL
jgi:hypothetical protein